jgi:hypothetical protein
LKSNLKEQCDFAEQFDSWFASNLKPTLEDNRRRYRMELEDKEERESRGLSALPSTKSTSSVDRAVEKAVMEYHGEPDAISYSANMSGDIATDLKAKWLTEIFKYRSEHTFPFPVWHVSSLTAGFTDGLEAALVWWRKESYTDTRTVYQAMGPQGPAEISEEEYQLYSGYAPDMVQETEVEEEQVLVDSWWVDQLRPGEDILWDIKAPLLDLNLGGKVLVKLQRSIDDIRQMADLGVIDKAPSDEELRKHQKNEPGADTGKTAGDTEGTDLGDLNRLEVWLYFAKVKGRWEVSFSIEGKLELSEPKSVNEVFFDGRKVNRLPVVMGTTKIKLWEAVGRGIPETIAPVEDEWTDHRNNLNDAAKLALKGKWRLRPDSDVDIDSLLNEEVFYANEGDATPVVMDSNISGSMRAADAINADLNELVPVGMDSKQVVPKGVDKTLGAVQLALGASNEKLSVGIMVRNFTFFRPLLHLIAQLEMAFETDETIARIAGQKVKHEQEGQQMPFNPPQVQGQQGPMVDFSQLDLDVDIRINAGLGSVPRQQKVQNLMMAGQYAEQAGIQVDKLAMFKQGMVLIGFDEDSFNPQLPQQAPPGPELKGTINIDLALLPEQVQMMLLQKFMEGSQEIKANVTGDMPKEMKDLMAAQQTPVMTGEPDLGGMDAGY